MIEPCQLKWNEKVQIVVTRKKGRFSVFCIQRPMQRSKGQAKRSESPARRAKARGGGRSQARLSDVE